MKFSADFIDKVRDANNIVDIIGQYTQLSHKGHQHMGLCPFPDHNEKSASFSVSELKQLYHCFGCKKSGNIFTFVQDMKSMNFPEAVEFLAERASIPIPVDSQASEKEATQYSELRDKKKLMFKINLAAARYYYQNYQKLVDTHKAKKYLSSRITQDDIISFFKLGYASDQWESLAHHLKVQKFPLELAAEMGLLKKKTQGGFYDVFRDRIIFPIFSHSGESVGFGGRVIDQGQPKYLNSPESAVFSKGRIFYGLYENAKFIRSLDEVIIVEGYMDLLALFQAGFKNVVATLGTALTESHAKLIKRYSRNVIVLFDGDSAGQSAAQRSLPILLSQGLFPRGLTLPENLDPDEYIQKYGVESLKDKMQSSRELFYSLLDQAMQGYTGAASDKIVVIEKMAPILLACSDKSLMMLYVDEIQGRLQVDERWLMRALAPYREKNAKPHSFSTPSAPKSEPQLTQKGHSMVYNLAGISNTERFLVNLALLDENLLKLLENHEILEQFSHKVLAAFLHELNQLYGQMPNKFDTLSASVISKVEPKSVLGLQFDEILTGLNEEDRIKFFKDCIRKIKEAYLNRQAKNLSNQLRGKSSKEQLGELEQLMNIQKTKLSLKNSD